jgi:hypothetical protein
MANKETKTEGGMINSLPIEGTVSSSYIPDGFADAEAFLKDMREQYETDVEFDRENRRQALDDKKFAAGEQWDPIVLEQRKGLPCLVINQIPQFTAQLVGDWRQSRKSVKVLPSNDEDVDVATIRGDLIRAIEVQSRAQRVYDSAFESLVQCGDGAYRVSVEYSHDDVFDQDIFIRPIEDCHSVVWDRYSVDPTGRDAKRVFVNDRIDKKEFKKKWPKQTPDELQAESLVDEISTSGWADDHSYRITEYWRLIERQRLLVMFQNGKIYEVNAENQDELIAKYGQPVKIRTSWCSFAQMHLVTGFTILSGPYEYRLNRLPIIRMSGRVTNIGGRRVRYGLVRFMKDAVRLKNFWRSTAAEQLGYAPKAKWLAPESAVEGREDEFRKAHLSRDPLLVYNDGAETPPELIEAPQIQSALLNEANLNAQDMKDVTGIHDASLGIKSNETSGRAIQARQREGDVASLTFYDNAEAAVLETGDVINQLIPQIYDGTRVIRLVGEDDSQRFSRINDPMDPESIDLSVGQFDVALSTGASYTTKRVEAAQSMMDAVQVYPQLMSVAGDLIARAQDWPGADKIAERLEQQMQQSNIDPQQLQGMQQELQKLQSENMMLKLAAKNDANKHEVDIYNAETQRIRALSDNMVDGNAMEMEAIREVLDRSAQLDDQEISKTQIAHAHAVNTQQLGLQQQAQEQAQAQAQKPKPE